MLPHEVYRLGAGGLPTEEILAIFDRLNKEGRTIIMVTHEDEVAARARRIVRLRDGLVQEDIRSRELPSIVSEQSA